MGLPRWTLEMPTFFYITRLHVTVIKALALKKTNTALVEMSVGQ